MRMINGLSDWIHAAVHGVTPLMMHDDRCIAVRWGSVLTLKYDYFSYVNCLCAGFFCFVLVYSNL